MFKKFETKHLIFLTFVAVLLFIADFSISISIWLATGIPGLGYAFAGIIFVLIATIGGLTVRKFGAFSIMALIYSLIAIPTPVMGPPGVYKIVMGLIVGILVDIFVFIFRYKKLGYYIAMIIGNAASAVIFVMFAVLFKFPRYEAFVSALKFLAPLYGAEAIFSVWLAFKIYNKLKNKRVIKQLES